MSEAQFPPEQRQICVICAALWPTAIAATVNAANPFRFSTKYTGDETGSSFR
jgi:hypothetical protein